MRTGKNTEGTALEARTAVAVSPRWNSTPSPKFKSVATMPKRMGNSSILRPWVWAVT